MIFNNKNIQKSSPPPLKKIIPPNKKKQIRDILVKKPGIGIPTWTFSIIQVLDAIGDTTRCKSTWNPNMEPENEGLWKMMFLFKPVVFSGLSYNVYIYI